jgi:hypothetical protein
VTIRRPIILVLSCGALALLFSIAAIGDVVLTIRYRNAMARIRELRSELVPAESDLATAREDLRRSQDVMLKDLYALSAAEKELLDVVPAKIQMSCHKTAGLAFKRVVALKCNGSGNVELEYYRFDTERLMRAAFDERVDSAETGSCSSPSGSFRYQAGWIQGDKDYGGRVSCFIGDDQSLGMEWTDPRSNVYGVARLSEYSNLTEGRKTIVEVWQSAV